MEKKLIEVVALQDNDGHWYVIPKAEKGDFNYLLEGGYETEDEFISRFSDYMTGGDLNNTQLYAKI